MTFVPIFELLRPSTPYACCAVNDRMVFMIPVFTVGHSGAGDDEKERGAAGHVLHELGDGGECASKTAQHCPRRFQGDGARGHFPRRGEYLF